MKKILGALLVFILVLTACSSGEEDKTITVGATSVPHAEILEQAKPLVEEQGYELEIVVYNDYVLPNTALDNGDLDANYFQHKPYLDTQIEEFGYDFTAIEPIHVEPIGFYSHKYSDISELQEGDVVYLSSSVADHGRALSLLVDNDIITLKEGTDRTSATIEDIDSNPLNLEFKYDLDASFLPDVYLNKDDNADLILINTNYALSKGIDPSEALIIEGSESDYANYLVSRTEDKDSEKIEVLKNALTDKSIDEYINDQYDGAVVPVD